MYATVIVKKLIMVRGVPSRLMPQYSDSCRRRQFMRTNVTRQFRSRERKWVRTKRPGIGIGDYASVTQGDWTGAGSTACTPTDPPGAAPDWRGRVWYLGNTIALLTQSRLTHACLWDEEYWLRCWCNSQYSSLYDCVWWAESACVLLQTLVYVPISRTYRENGWIIFFRHAWQVYVRGDGRGHVRYTNVVQIVWRLETSLVESRPEEEVCHSPTSFCLKVRLL